MENFFGDERKKIVFVPDHLAFEAGSEIRGRFFEDTKIFNVFPPSLAEQGDFLGSVVESGCPTDELLCAVSAPGGVCFYSKGEEVVVEKYTLSRNIFSRTTGILETDVMLRRRVVISGCGSVGSLVAMELARCGVGHFFLADPDTLEYHNLCRHQCGIEDVGDLKINALRRKILNINPSAEVVVVDRVIENAPKTLLDEFCVSEDTLFVGCADNRSADVYLNRISIFYGAPFLSIGFWERAFAGEIFYHIPGKGMPCYECALGSGSTLSARAQANHHVYSNHEDLEALKFVPGISTDINFITTIGIKLAIDILNRNDSEFVPRLLGNLTQYTLVCNTSDTHIGGDIVEIFSYPLQVTTSLAVMFRGSCDGKCRFECEEEQEGK